MADFLLSDGNTYNIDDSKLTPEELESRINEIERDIIGSSSKKQPLSDSVVKETDFNSEPQASNSPIDSQPEVDRDEDQDRAYGEAAAASMVESEAVQTEQIRSSSQDQVPVLEGRLYPAINDSDEFDADDLVNDDYWLDAANTIYELEYGKKFDGDVEDLSNYARRTMSQFNNNPWFTTGWGIAVTNSSQREKESFLYLLDKFDKTNMSWRGAAYTTGALALDPLNYAGALSFGATAAAGQTAKAGAKIAVRAILVDNIKKHGGAAAITNGLIAGGSMATFDYQKQSIAVSAGAQEEMDYARVAKNAGLGVALGYGGTVVLGTAIGAASHGLSKVFPKNPVAATPNPATTNPSSPTNGSTLSQTSVSANGSRSFEFKRADATGAQATVSLSDKTKNTLVLDQVNVSALGQNATPKVVASLLRDSIDEAQAVGKNLVTKDEVTQDAMDVWNKLRSDGYPIRINPKASFDPAAQVFRTADGSPVIAVLHDAKVPAVTADILLTPGSHYQIPFKPRSIAEARANGGSMLRAMHGFAARDTEALLDHLQVSGLTGTAKDDFQLAVQDTGVWLQKDLSDLVKARVSETDPVKVAALVSKQAEIEDQIQAIQQVRDALVSPAGRTLRLAQEGMASMKGVTPKTLMAKNGWSAAKAEAHYQKMVEKANLEDARRALFADYDDKIQKAIASNDIAEASRHVIAKSNAQKAKDWEDLSLGGKAYSTFNKGADGAVEVAIANVFSVKTVQINLVPSLVKIIGRPAYVALLKNPFLKSSRAEMVASYLAIGSVSKQAFRAARLAMKYERTIMTGSDWMNTSKTQVIPNWFAGGKIPSPVPGGLIRSIPRILTATDELFSQVAYASYVAGQAASNAAEAGIEQGLKGRQLRDYIKSMVEQKMSTSTTNAVDEGTISIIVNKGIGAGLKGDRLEKYVISNLKDIPGMVRGLDEEAVINTERLLYKQKFDKTTTLGMAASSYEDFVNKHPIMKLAGQLFFRVVVWVFDEGTRITPGVQLLNPGLRAELLGKKGAERQLAAQGYILASVGVAFAAMQAMQSETVQGGFSYLKGKDKQAQADGDQAPVWSLKTGEGEYKSIRYMDPIATPIKFIATGMEMMKEVEKMRHQGLVEDQSLTDKAVAAFSYGIFSMAQVIKDQQMLGGATTVMDAIETALDKDSSSEDVWRIINSKLSMATPNTIRQFNNAYNPERFEPVTLDQAFEVNVLSPYRNLRDQIGETIGYVSEEQAEANRKSGVVTAGSYDALGNRRQHPKGETMWNMMATTTQADLKRDRSDKDVFVINKLNEITRINGTSFVGPTKFPMLLGGKDLRTVLTKDGKETVYDKYQRILKNGDMVNDLYEVLSDPTLAIGNSKSKGMGSKIVSQIVNMHREAAFYEVMESEDPEMLEYIKSSERSFEDEGGERELPGRLRK